MLDEWGEELWLDLRHTYGFDLVSYLAGGVAGSPRLILAMIRNLPEGTRYVAALASAREESDDEPNESDTDTDPNPIAEHMTWTTDRVLMAQLINSVNMLVRHSVQWEKPPQIPLVGPAAWREGDKKQRKATSVMDVLNRITGQHG